MKGKTTDTIDGDTCGYKFLAWLLRDIGMEGNYSLDCGRCDAVADHIGDLNCPMNAARGEYGDEPR
jgi:hypothetical protein